MRKGRAVGASSCGDDCAGGVGWRNESEREKRGGAPPARLTPEKEIHRESTLRESELSPRGTKARSIVYSDVSRGGGVRARQGECSEGLAAGRKGDG